MAIANALVPVLPALVKAILALVPVLPPLLRAMANLLPVVVPLLVAMARIIARLAPSVVQFARALVPVATAVGDLAGPLRRVTNAAMPWVATFMRIEQTIRTGFLKTVGTLLVGALKGVGTHLRIIANLLTGNFQGAFDVARNAVKDLWGWLDNLNNKLHEYMVKLDSLPGIEIPGIGDEEHRRPPLGPLDKTAPHGPLSQAPINYHVTAYDIEHLDRQVRRRVRQRNAGGVVFGGAGAS
jgi:phage-related minor tail protein